VLSRFREKRKKNEGRNEREGKKGGRNERGGKKTGGNGRVKEEKESMFPNF